MDFPYMQVGTNCCSWIKALSIIIGALLSARNQELRLLECLEKNKKYSIQLGTGLIRLINIFKSLFVFTTLL